MNITVDWGDVLSVIDQIMPYLIILGLAFVAMIAVMYFAGKKKKPNSSFIRIQSLIAFITLLVLIVNIIVLGPLQNLITVAVNDLETVSDESISNSREVIEEIASEGIVLAKNEDNLLPLNDTSNINVFGWASTNPVYGGTGSGTVDISTAVDLLSGLENAGFEINDELREMYTEYESERGIISINDGQDWSLPEPPVNQYSEEMLENAKEFSSTAMIVIGRIGGEGADLPHDMGAVMDGSWNEPGTKYRRANYENNSTEYEDFSSGMTYLELSQTEQNLVDMVTDNFEEVIVVYNGSNTFELGWTEEYEEIKSVLLAGGLGATGFNALGEIVSGNVNPSGRTADTWVYDLTSTPYFNNIGHFELSNVDNVVEVAGDSWPRTDGIASFINYVEGMYVGYRFYETAADEELINYDSVVQYPFGHGLSYTSFSQEITEFQEEDGSISLEVMVSNTGSVPGKETVQIYYNPPYNNGGIEKSSANLIAFDKTDMLEPGESQTLNLSYEIDEMASFDTYGTGRYVLEEGDYGISLRSDSHTIIEERIFALNETIIYDEMNTHLNDRIVAEPRLQFAEGDVNYLSREDGFSNYEDVTGQPENFEINMELLATGTYDPTDYNDSDDVMPDQDIDNGLEVEDIQGISYDDPMWEEFLNQLTIEEMRELIAWGGHGTVGIESIGLLPTTATDGPAGLNSPTLNAFGTGYVSQIVIAQTWNVDLSYLAAEGILQEFADVKILGWYAPSMNIHRNAFNGRNFEYYSEDPILSAKMAIPAVQAAYDQGIVPYLKHFAFNEQETNRNAILTTWLPEQAAREVYLKPFEYTVKANDGSALAMMSVFNYIGNEWGGSTPELLNDILRDEWGFRGMVITDYFGDYGYMDADRAIRGGSDLMLGTTGGRAYVDDQSATSVIAMRQASKNIIYTLVNSDSYDDFTANSVPNWIKKLLTVDVVFVLLLLLMQYRLIKKYNTFKKA